MEPRANFSYNHLLVTGGRYMAAFTPRTMNTRYKKKRKSVRSSATTSTSTVA